MRVYRCEFCIPPPVLHGRDTLSAFTTQSTVLVVPEITTPKDFTLVANYRETSLGSRQKVGECVSHVEISSVIQTILTF